MSRVGRACKHGEHAVLRKCQDGSSYTRTGIAADSWEALAEIRCPHGPVLPLNDHDLSASIARFGCGINMNTALPSAVLAPVLLVMLVRLVWLVLHPFMTFNITNWQNRSCSLLPRSSKQTCPLGAHRCTSWLFQGQAHRSVASQSLSISIRKPGIIQHGIILFLGAN